MRFPIIIEKDKFGYYATCPSLAGCSTQGGTYEETLKNIKDAIMLYVKDCIDDNDVIIANETVSFHLLDLPLEMTKKKKR